jgi:hypothetical protein
MEKLTVSTATPIYVGGNYLLALVEKIEQIRDKWNTADTSVELLEAIFVKDAAIDDSLDILEQLRVERPCIIPDGWQCADIETGIRYVGNRRLQAIF